MTLAPGLVMRLGLHAHLVDGRLRVGVLPHVGHFETQQHVGAEPTDARAIQRMRGGEIHAEMLVDDGGLQRFGQFHQQLDAFRRARHAAGDDHGILGSHQHLRGFSHGAGIARGRRGERQLRNSQLAAIGVR